MNMNDYHAEFEKITSRPYFSDKINGSRPKAFEKFIISNISKNKQVELPVSEGGRGYCCLVEKRMV